MLPTFSNSAWCSGGCRHASNRSRFTTTEAGYKPAAAGCLPLKFIFSTLFSGPERLALRCRPYCPSSGTTEAGYKPAAAGCLALKVRFCLFFARPASLTASIKAGFSQYQPITAPKDYKFIAPIAVD